MSAIAGAAVVHEHVDRVRRELWRAYQAGKLSEDEFASRLDHLDWREDRVDRLQGDERCKHCGLLGMHALQAEQTVARLLPARIWRHINCQHVWMWRVQYDSPASPLPRHDARASAAHALRC